jgi:hypothetical protein
MIIEYKMHMTAGGMRTPEWVEDGGYFSDDATNTKVGWSPDEADREYYVPDTVTTMTLAELKTKLLAMHETTKFQKAADNGTMSDMTNAEVNTMAADWVAARS